MQRGNLSLKALARFVNAVLYSRKQQGDASSLTFSNNFLSVFHSLLERVFTGLRPYHIVIAHKHLPYR